jgi:hypothetical protein
VPLDRVTKRPASAEPFVAPGKPEPQPPEPPEPRPPHRFRVVDLMTRQTLADDVSAREAVDALNGVRSVVDVKVYVWSPEREMWRPLTYSEQHALWELHEAEPSTGE